MNPGAQSGPVPLFFAIPSCTPAPPPGDKEADPEHHPLLKKKLPDGKRDWGAMGGDFNFFMNRLFDDYNKNKEVGSPAPSPTAAPRGRHLRSCSVGPMLVRCGSIHFPFRTALDFLKSFPLWRRRSPIPTATNDCFATVRAFSVSHRVSLLCPRNDAAAVSQTWDSMAEDPRDRDGFRRAAFS